MESIFSKYPKTYKAVKAAVPAKPRLKDLYNNRLSSEHLFLTFKIYDYADPEYRVCLDHDGDILISHQIGLFVNDHISRQTMIDSIFLKVLQRPEYVLD